ncbi:FAS1-like dehydratase domain-containing protein [Propionibacteriaceae bacterium Y2011]
MPITPEHTGREYPPTAPYEITAVKVAEFTTALGERDVHRVPPTFAMVVLGDAWQAMFDDPELGLALHRIVHGDQKFSWERPLRIGDVVTATLRIDRVVQRGGVDMITSVASVDTVDGEHVATASALFLHTPETEPDAS